MVAANTVMLPCLYCGQPTKPGARGEHVIPKAIDGKCTLLDFPPRRRVCQVCNNGVLSQLDDELCRL